MAKFGTNQEGYDPFASIQTSLTALKEPPARSKEKPASDPNPREQVPSKDVPIERTTPPPPKPTRRIDGGGGGGSASEQSVPPVSAASSLSTTKRFKTTVDESVKLDQATIRLAAKLGINVDFSKLTRALWDAYLRHEDDILRNIPEGLSWKRPANNDPIGLAELEERLTELINDGFMVASHRRRNQR